MRRPVGLFEATCSIRPHSKFVETINSVVDTYIILLDVAICHAYVMMKISQNGVSVLTMLLQRKCHD